MPPPPGAIESVTEVTAPHASGLPQTAIVLEPDGKDEWAPLPTPIADPLAADPQVIQDAGRRVRHRRHGRRRLPLGGKLTWAPSARLETLLINGAECEPYLTCDDRVMREHAEEVIDGARIMAHALGARTGHRRHRGQQAAGPGGHDPGGRRLRQRSGASASRSSTRWAPSAIWSRRSPAARPRRASSPPISASWCTTSPPPTPCTRRCALAAR